MIVILLPGNAQPTIGGTERTIFGGVDGEFMQRHAERLCNPTGERAVLAFNAGLTLAGKWMEFAFDERAQPQLFPTAFDEQFVGARHRCDAPIKIREKSLGLDIMACGLPRDRRDFGHEIADAMIIFL